MNESREIDVAALRTMLDQAKEVDPYEEDGSYALVQRAGQLYYKSFPEKVTHADLDLFYYLVTIRYQQTQDNKIRACSLSEQAKSELICLNAELHEKFRAKQIERKWDPRKMGMFKGAFGTLGRGNGVPGEEVKPLIELFSWLCGNKDASSDEKISRVEAAFDHSITGFKNGTASIILHCIDPCTFPVINSNQGRNTVYSVLDVEGLTTKPNELNDLTRYAGYCRAIESFRDNSGFTFKNYRVIDRVGFNMPVVRKKSVATFINPLEGASENELLDALERLHSDIGCLDEVNKLLAKVNLFDVLKITRTEIRHSNVLAWLLDACQNHGFGELFLSRFLGFIDDVELEPDMDYADFTVRTELTIEDGGRIDLLLESEKNNIVVAIENKTFTGEHDDQLTRYFDHVNKTYPERERYFVYLTPEGSEASDSENWQSLGYRQIAEVLDECLNHPDKEAPADAKMIVEHYIEAVKSDVLGENPVKEAAKAIYRKHRLALDALFEWRPDELTDVMERLGEELQDLGAHVIRADKGGVYFRTEQLDATVPLLDNPGFYGDETACCLGVVANGDVVGLTFRYPISSNTTAEEDKLRNGIIEQLNGNPENERWVNSDFRIERSAGELYRSEEELKSFAEDVLTQANDFVDDRLRGGDSTLENRKGHQ